MRLRLFTIVMTLGLMITVRAARAESSEPRLPDFMLDSHQFLSLDLDERVAYLKFFMNMMASVEDMENISDADKKALLEPQHRWLDFVIETADAATFKESLEGKTCINSLNQSHWVYDSSSHRLYCAPVAQAGHCGAGRVTCAQQLTDLAPGLGEVCITPPARGQRPSYTARCVREIEKKAGATLDGRLQSRALSLSNSKARQRYDELARQVRSALTTFESQRMESGVSLREYCAKGHRASASYGIQKEECDSLLSLQDSFDTITSLKTSPYEVNSLTSGSTPTVRKQLASLHEERKKPHGRFFLPRSLRKNAPSSDEFPPPPPPPAPATTANTTPAQKSHSSKLSKKKKASVSDKNCVSRNQAKLGALACVACGLSDAASADLEYGNGADNWLTLVGIMAQTYYGPYNVQDSYSRRQFQQRVIDMISSYGYCTDREYPIDTSSSADKVRNWLDGRQHLQQGVFFPNADEKQFTTIFGLESDKKNIFGHAQNSGMCYARQVFDDSDKYYGFDTGNVQERQWRFRSMIKAHQRAFPTTAFSKCAVQLDSRLARSSYFRMCPVHMARTSKGVVKPAYNKQITGAELANNDKLYGAMTSACGLPNQRKMPSQKCDNQCWYGGAYNLISAGLTGCQDAVDTGPKGLFGFPPSEPGEPSGSRSHSDRNEPSHSREGHYGGDHGASEGGGDGSGSGGSGGGPAGSGGKGGRGESSSAR